MPVTVRLKELMGQPPVVTSPDAEAEGARRLMREKKIHALPVVDAEMNPLGLLSSTDVLCDREVGRPVSALMSSPAVTIEQFKTVRHAAELMRERHIHHIVVTHHGKVVGVVSTYDLLGLLCTHKLVPQHATGPKPELGP